MGRVGDARARATVLHCCQCGTRRGGACHTAGEREAAGLGEEDEAIQATEAGDGLPDVLLGGEAEVGEVAQDRLAPQEYVWKTVPGFRGLDRLILLT